MDSLKQKNVVLRRRCHKLHKDLIDLENRAQLAKLQAESAIKWSDQLRERSSKLDEILNQLAKAS